MARRTDADTGRRRIWRVTASAPLGEFVDSEQIAKERTVGAPEFTPSEAGWLQSSFDLAIGLEVSDASDVITPEAFEHLFRR